MVKSHRLISVCSLASCVPALAGVRVRTVEIVSDRAIEIKPCQLVTVAIAITLDGQYGPNDCEAIGSELARDVNVNGHVFSSRFGPVNEAAIFEVDASSIQKQDGTTRASAAVILHWNLADQTFIFDQPGKYEVRLIMGATIRVSVLQPSAEEWNIVSELRQMGLDFSAGLTNPGDAQRAMALLPKLEALLQKWPNTSYTAMLAPYVGIAKLYAMSSSRALNEGDDPARYMAERVDISAKYILPYVDEIDSAVETTAALTAATDLISKSRFEAGEPARANALEEIAVQVLKKIVASPYAGAAREMATRKLQKWDSK